MHRIAFLAACTLLFSWSLQGQLDLGMHQMTGVWQGNLSNPAALPNNPVAISLPGVYNALWNSGFTWSDAVQNDQNGQRFLDVDGIINALKKENFLREQLDIQTLALGIRAGKWFFSAGHQMRFQAYLRYPRELAQVVWKGNASFIGQTIPIGPDLFSRGYHELSVGLAFQPKESLTLGARFKFLGGIGDASTSRNTLELFTSDDIYQLTLHADYQLNATAPLAYSGFDDFTLDIDASDYPLNQLFGNNSGFALDLGAVIAMNRLTLRASVLDLGRIKWKQDASNLSLTGNFEFKGLDVFQQVLEDTSNVAGGILDSLEAIYDIRQSSIQYLTPLPVRSYLSASLALNETWELNALVYGELLGKRFFPAYALGAQMRVGNFLQWGLLYAIRHARYNNIGMNMALKLGPIQLLAATDHLTGLFGLSNAHQANLRLGMNLLFGQSSREKEKKKKPAYLNERKFFN